MDRRAYLALSGSLLFLSGTVYNQTSTGQTRSGDVGGADRARADSGDRGAAIQATTREELVSALETASPGEVVSIPAGATIDLTGLWMLEVPSGVTLTSGGVFRGQEGALLDTSEGDDAPEIGLSKLYLEAGARLTGVRLRGHHHEYVNPAEEYDDDYYAHRGSGVYAEPGAVVDNNEISGWLFSAVWAHGDAHVHHNYIHHNTWEGLGYGVYVPAGENMPTIEYNDFNYNRHSIAAGGGPEVGYVARYNVVGPDWVGHQFDMHGDEGMIGIAGDEIYIRNNTFRATHTVPAKTRNPDALVPAIFIRGTPETGVWVEDNHFYHESRDTAYQQSDGPHKVHFDGNTYGRPDGRSESSWRSGLSRWLP